MTSPNTQITDGGVASAVPGSPALQPAGRQSCGPGCRLSQELHEARNAHQRTVAAVDLALRILSNSKDPSKMEAARLVREHLDGSLPDQPAMPDTRKRVGDGTVP